MGIKRGVTASSGRATSSEGHDFVTLQKPKLQANVLIFGDNGQGKSTFCTRFAPDPLAFINFDRRAAHAVYAATQSGRRIPFLGVDFPANITKLGDDQARKLGQQAVDSVVKNFEWAVRESQKGNIRTIALDTGTEYSEILKIAITGRVDKTKGDYGKSKDLINREWWRLFNLAREGNAHFIVLARAQEIWLNNEPTGRMKARGPEVMSDGADWAGHIRLKKALGKKPKKEFELEIVKAGINIEELCEVYSEKQWEDYGGPFTYACLMQYSGSEQEDWE